MYVLIIIIETPLSLFTFYPFSCYFTNDPFQALKKDEQSDPGAPMEPPSIV